MPPTRSRLIRVHADFHFNKHDKAFDGDTRHGVEAILRKNPVVDFQARKLPRLEMWREKTRYAFVASPHGHGLDCHRTWESILLGNIVIVRRSSLDALYDGLPVVIVDDWRDISPAKLRRWHGEYSDAFASDAVLERLTNQYWLARMRREVSERTRDADYSAPRAQVLRL